MRGEDKTAEQLPVDKNQVAEEQKARDANRELARQQQEKDNEGKPLPIRSYPGITQDPDAVSKAQVSYTVEELNVVYPEPSTTADNITTGLTERERQDQPKKHVKKEPS